MTGYYPAQHGVKYTLEENMPDDQFPQVELPRNFKNLGTVMSAAGYNVVYKGKWHLSKPAGSAFAPSDVAQYGFARWRSAGRRGQSGCRPRRWRDVRCRWALS